MQPEVVAEVQALVAQAVPVLAATALAAVRLAQAQRTPDRVAVVLTEHRVVLAAQVSW